MPNFTNLIQVSLYASSVTRHAKLTTCFSSSQRDYPKSLSQCLQERGLSVEMLYLQEESGLTRALQDVRADGSSFCILVEQTNVALSSCTVIIFSESLKSKSLPLLPSSVAKSTYTLCHYLIQSLMQLSSQQGQGQYIFQNDRKQNPST